MGQTSQLLSALKKFLKAKGVTYQLLAAKLAISEASVKRLFSEQSFSLKRIEEICEILEISFFDLAQKGIEEVDKLSTKLTIAQEATLADDPKLLIFFYLLITGWNTKDIHDKYAYSKIEINRFTIDLEKLELIESLGEKIKLLISQNVVWRKDGPIRKRFENQIRDEFFDGEFNGKTDKTRLDTGELSPASMQILSRKIDKLFLEFNDLISVDKSLPKKNKQSVGLLIGFRPWVFSLLKSLQRSI